MIFYDEKVTDSCISDKNSECDDSVYKKLSFNSKLIRTLVFLNQYAFKKKF